jgi:pimeloyl-ACP methyl ester carboxylesterase
MRWFWVMAAMAVGWVSVGPVLSQPARAPSRTVEVEGGGLALYTAGNGSPTIVLEAGFGADHRAWADVQPLLEGRARVVSYDRLGLGASGPSKRPRSAAIAAEQLREGLRQAGIAPPFLLVGHSYGGAIVRIFADRWPGEVLGLVLVDPALEDFYTRATLEEPAAYRALLEGQLAEDEGASPAVQREALAWETSMLQLRQTRPVAGSRTVLISARRMLAHAPPLQRLWLEVATRWAGAVGAQHVVLDAEHDIPQREPQAVVRAVERLLALPAAR